MAASARFLCIAVIFCHGVAGGDVSDSKCAVKVLQFWRKVEALIKGPACRGLSNARVCSADAFSSLLGDEDAGKVRGWRRRAITPQTRTPRLARGSPSATSHSRATITSISWCTLYSSEMRRGSGH